MTLRRVVSVPAAPLSGAQLAALTWSDAPGDETEGGVMLASGAEQHGLPWTAHRWEVTDPAGSISRADEAALNDRVVDTMQVERGFESPTRIVLLVLLGVAGALVAVGALLSTVLGQIEARTDQAVLAALGARPGFRRRLAAAQAALVAGLGALVGVLLGIAPGLALGRSFTTDRAQPDGSYPSAILVVPWWTLVAVLVLVPTTCAILAALITRRSPDAIRARA